MLPAGSFLLCIQSQNIPACHARDAPSEILPPDETTLKMQRLKRLQQ